MGTCGSESYEADSRRHRRAGDYLQVSVGWDFADEPLGGRRVRAVIDVFRGRGPDPLSQPGCGAVCLAVRKLGGKRVQIHEDQCLELVHLDVRSIIVVTY